ncbi:Ldh family oxidoreductase [Micromonospora sp. FIMYZ51]|uniref:Ldh family oxidoreductase n=1 Tax=Micromonospora sp. FIMYZ51 TaxID=3051832 RepID=UPI00311FB307
MTPDHAPADGRERWPTRRVPVDRLVEYVTACYLQVGVPARAARTVARSQVDTDRRGVVSHGTRLTGGYLAKLADGRLNPRPRIRLINRNGVCARMDADLAVGPWAAAIAVRYAVTIATRGGAAVVALAGCGHIGAAGSPALHGALAGVLTIVVGQTGKASVVPFGATEAVLGNTPLAVAVPNGGRPPILVDLACGTASWGAVSAHATAGRLLPPGWAYAVDGQPTRDPHRAAVLRAFGGAKGSALAVTAEILAGAFTGSTALPSGERRGLLAITISPDALGVADKLGINLDQLARAVRSARPSSTESAPRMPGDRAWQTVADADWHGIPLGDEHLASLIEAGHAHGVDPTSLTESLTGMP